MKKLIFLSLLVLTACATGSESQVLYDKGFRAGCDAGRKTASFLSYDKTLIQNIHYKIGWEQGLQVCEVEVIS